jgi:hypothetical protein
VSDEQLPREADVAEVSSKLSEGLETCRSVVMNYRSLLSSSRAEIPTNDNDPQANSNLSEIDER